MNRSRGRERPGKLTRSSKTGRNLKEQKAVYEVAYGYGRNKNDLQGQKAMKNYTE